MRWLVAWLLRVLLTAGPSPYRVYTHNPGTRYAPPLPQIQRYKNLAKCDLKRFLRSRFLIGKNRFEWERESTDNPGREDHYRLWL